MSMEMQLEQERIAAPPRTATRVWSSARTLQFLSVAVFLVIWEIVGSFMNPILIPQPSSVVTAFGDLIATGRLLEAFLISLVDFGLGFLFATVVGISVGLLMGRYALLDQAFSPFVNFMMATPGIALTPLIIIWFGIQLEARVFMVFLLAVWSILVNTATGVKNTNKILREVSLSFGLTDQQYLRWIAFPNAIPYVFAGLRIGLGKGVIGMIIAEMEMRITGLGGLIITYGNQFQTNYLIAGVITSSIFGVFVAGTLALVQAKFFPWIAGQAGKEHLNF